ncbi:MAG: hypothetical protein SVG88_15095 [Halobacteriales archaeon]|nr:hypothetical protein [Halobacteriales archaeon]
MATVRPTVVSALALLALVPVVVFLLDRFAMVVALSVVSVVIIAASLYSMFGSTDVDDHDTEIGGDEGPTVVE